MKKKILVVEDEPDIQNLLAFHLRMAGFDVIGSPDGEQALAVASQDRPDLIILDIMLPGLSGWEVCRLIKRHRQIRDTPVLILTARTGLNDRLKGFSVGAEDYLCKPFSFREAVLRVKALLRRVEASEGSNGKKVFRIGEEIVLDFSRHSFSKGGSQLRLTPKESCILRHLLERTGQVVRREELLRDVWGDNVFVELGNIEVHIRHLREKIEPDPAKPAHLITVRGVGYRFEN
ncbi:MAG: response regulator transcription factor [Acidobacteriota bacterium]